MPTKPYQLKPFVEPGSISDAVIHFVFIYNKSFQDVNFDILYTANKQKYKNKHNLKKCLSRLFKNDLLNENLNGNYELTPKGYECIERLAMLRRKKHAAVYVKQKSRANQNGTHFDPDSF